MIFLCIGNSLTAGYPAYYPAFDGFSKGNGNFQSQYEYWLKNYCVEYEKITAVSETVMGYCNKSLPAA